ncbi:MAG TPA: hypothetical protein VF031_03620, partial [Alphaproteobacteria bacterium]
AGGTEVEPCATRLVRFEAAGRHGGIAVSAPDSVLALATLFLHGWGALSPARDSEVAVRCAHVTDGFDIAASVLPGGRHRAASAFEAADVVASAVAALAIGGPEVILPHAAALASPAGLVLLFADTTGGKSTLALTLAAAGWRLFGDDRLGLRRAPTGSVGVALGLAPKLRLPLPASAKALSEFARKRVRQSWPSLAYLQLAPEEQAGPGTEAPVAACLLLDRGGGAPTLEPAHPARLVRALAESAAAPWLAPAEVMAAAAAHAGLPAFHLGYAEAAEAVPLLTERFGQSG